MSGSSSKREPDSFLVTLGTGHPMLISMISAVVCASTNLAASTNVVASPPKIWIDSGFGMPSKSSIESVLAFRCSIPLSEIISVTTSPAPNSLAKLKNALFEIPAIGASTILLLISTLPIFHGVV